MKKILKSFFAMMMVLCLGTTSFANGTTGTGSITINNNSEQTGISMVGHTYSVYNVFNATISGDKYAYSVSDEFKDYFKSKAKTEDVDVDTDSKLNKFAVDYVDGFKDKMQELTKDLRDYVVKNNITPAKTSDKATAESVTISGLPLGYYLVLDNGNGSETSEKNPIAAAALGTTNTDLEITLKGSAPTIDKDIEHDGDGNWGNVGDNQIGDTVNYRLTATIPTDLTGYNKYTYIIHDTLSEGLTFNKDIEIYVGEKGKGGVKLEKNYEVTNNPSDGHTFDINVNILGGIAAGKGTEGFEAGDTLYIYYSAVLNENALIAGDKPNDSNDNTVDLEYSNNPYDDNDTDTTPEVTVEDYTFKISALKTDGDNNPLAGAKFQLSTEDGVAIYFKVKGNQYVVCTEENHGTECTQIIISPENGNFEMIGLDDNIEYTLTETEAPDGYNTIDPIKFTIIAKYNDEGKLIEVTTSSDSIQDGDGNFVLDTTIVNTTGDELPETGGIGTTIFKVVGVSLMAVAAVLLITRYRLN